MYQKNRLLCCDWGTTNFRLYLLNTLNQEVLGQLKDAKGVAILFKEWKAQKEQNRIPFFRQFLQQKIGQLAEQTNNNLSQIPVILSGMSSSSIGMEEVAYTLAPFNIHQPQLNHKKIDATTTYPNDYYIFGGLRTQNDVMRGEEVQMVGIRTLLPKEGCLCILPGTHSKHISIKEDQLITFDTFITGEVFQLLKNHSILSASVATEPSVDIALDFFKKGVLESRKGNILNQLFKVRTNTILNHLSSTANQAYLSGLVIGTELKGLIHEKRPIVLGSGYALSFLYETALKTLFPDKEIQIISPKKLEEAIPKAHLFLYRQIN